MQVSSLTKSTWLVIREQWLKVRFPDLQFSGLLCLQHMCFISWLLVHDLWVLIVVKGF